MSLETESKAFWLEELKTDIKHCKLDEAEAFCECIAEEAANYIHEDEDMDDEFREMELDSLPDILSDGEFLWYQHWDSFIDFMREKYLD